MSVKSWFLALVCLGVLFSGAQGTFPEKKIIYFGWDMPSDTQRILEGIDEWQDLPFDGIAVRIEDPTREKDLDRSVSIGIAADEQASKYYEIRLTHDNERWDSLTPASVWPNETWGKDESWKGEYETGTHVAEDFAFWSAEVAIPWASINRSAPKSGEQIKANILQDNGRRASHGSAERTSWSQMRLNRLMIEDAARNSLGTWEFK